MCIYTIGRYLILCYFIDLMLLSTYEYFMIWRTDFKMSFSAVVLLWVDYIYKSLVFLCTIDKLCLILIQVGPC